MADFDQKPQDEFENDGMEDGVEYEYVDDDGNPASQSGIEYEYVDEDGNPASQSGVEYEYVDDDGNPASQSGVEYEYVDEDGNPASQSTIAQAEGEAYEELPDGMTVNTESAQEGNVSDEFGEAGDAGDALVGAETEDASEDEAGDAEKPKSFFNRLGEATPYEVMIWVSFFMLLGGILLMLLEWMSYDMMAYPKY